MTWLVATRNAGKQREICRALEAAGYVVVFPDEVPLPPDPAEELLEQGTTFEQNSLAKARWFCARTSLPTIADDSGLEVEALGGAPGVHSRRWSGIPGTGSALDTANTAHLLDQLAEVPPLQRRARYRCVLTLLRAPHGSPEQFSGSCSGTILAEPRGTEGFGYDPVFFSDELQKSFGEATTSEKAEVSHRMRALQLLVQALGARDQDR